MTLKFTILATAVIMLPAAVGAQTAPQAQPPAESTPAQPAADATAAPAADANAQATAKTDTTADSSGSVKAATKAEVKVGAAVYDSKGNSVGKIDSVDEKGAVLNTGKVQVKIPVASFAHGDKGLVIGMSKTEIEAAAKKPS